MVELNWPVLSASALDAGYGARTVLKGVDLTLAPSEVLCLLGRNGAGKTTLFKTLLGLLPPLAGKVRVRGHDLAVMPRREVARAIAYVPQAQVSDFAYTVADLVLMGRTAHLGPFAAPARDDRERARQALAELGIADLADADCTRISGGQRQLALIARALAQDAAAIVLDEPTASLDIANRALVLERIAGLAGRGIAIVLSTHEPEQAFDLATSVMVLHGGGIAVQGAPGAVLTDAVLSAVYDRPVVIERTASGRAAVGLPRLGS
jgi:iron complex transport system ATP-binding protein